MNRRDLLKGLCLTPLIGMVPAAVPAATITTANLIKMRDMLDRSEAYRKMIAGGVMTWNDARQLEGFPPVWNGDDWYVRASAEHSLSTSPPELPHDGYPMPCGVFTKVLP